jgi:cob(I)alamin adenosyltransferase
MKCGSFLDQNMIAQLNNHPENTSDSRNTLFQNYAPRVHHQIRIVETPVVKKAMIGENRFGTEIVADALKIAVTGERVLIVQLLKGGIRQGHDRVVNLAQNLDWIRCNLIRNITTADLNDLELHNFNQLWKHVRSTAKTGEYSLLILDDLSLSIELGLISIDAAIHFLTTLPENIKVTLTGTNPHPAILALVD